VGLEKIFTPALANREKYTHKVLCLVIVNVNVTVYVQQKCQKCHLSLSDQSINQLIFIAA